MAKDKKGHGSEKKSSKSNGKRDKFAASWVKEGRSKPVAASGWSGATARKRVGGTFGS